MNKFFLVSILLLIFIIIVCLTDVPKIDEIDAIEVRNNSQDIVMLKKFLAMLDRHVQILGRPRFGR